MFYDLSLASNGQDYRGVDRFDWFVTDLRKNIFF